MEYSYSFSPELECEWDWSELMASQPEIECYLNHVADRFELRRDITLGTRVTAAHFDADRQLWVLRTDRDETVHARYCVMATGCLSAPLAPDIPNIDSFAGTLVQTSLWPKEPVDFCKKRVALIGTGSSGVQAMPVIAETAAHLAVFQRSAAYTWPAMNRPLQDEDRRCTRAHYPQIRDQQRNSHRGVAGRIGALSESPSRRLLDLDEDERMAALEEYGFAVTQMFSDVATDPRANAIARKLYGEMLRRVVADPATAAALTPYDYPIGCKRNVMNIGYFEAFNRENVSLIDLRQEPIVEVTVAGLRTSRREIAFDIIVFATGFDAITGALERIDVRGRDCIRLKEVWAAGPRNYLGLMVSGFPNLFTITGPGSPGPLSNVVVSIEQHVEWIAACLEHLRARGASTIEATTSAEERWISHVNELAAGTMYTAPECSSWYLGANVPGKPRIFMPYAGGVGAYRKECDAVVAGGYKGFAIV